MSDSVSTQFGWDLSMQQALVYLQAETRNYHPSHAEEDKRKYEAKLKAIKEHLKKEAESENYSNQKTQ